MLCENREGRYSEFANLNMIFIFKTFICFLFPGARASQGALLNLNLRWLLKFRPLLLAALLALLCCDRAGAIGQFR